MQLFDRSRWKSLSLQFHHHYVTYTKILWPMMFIYYTLVPIIPLRDFVSYFSMKFIYVFSKGLN